MSNASPAVAVRALRRTFATGKGLRKKGPEVVALDHVDLTIPPGEVHGLLGPNGAGKTTLCKILSTVLLPTSGRVEVLGHDMVRQTAAVRPLIGIVFGGERGLYSRLTAQQNLRFWGALYGLSTREARVRADELMERVGLTERAHEPVEGYSRGMKQRLHLARGLVGDPPLLLLDEPTTGMDPVAARDFRKLVTELRDDGRTILLTTHDMAEAEAVCDRVSLIDNGSLLATERPATLGTWLSRFERIDAHDVPDDVLAEIAALPGVESATVGGNAAVRIATIEEGAAAVVLQRLLDRGVTSVSTSLPSLEEVYLHVIGDRGMTVRR